MLRVEKKEFIPCMSAAWDCGTSKFSTADQLVLLLQFIESNMADKTSSESGAGKLTQLPVARIKTIMKSSPDLPHFSQDSVFLVTKATVSFWGVH